MNLSCSSTVLRGQQCFGERYFLLKEICKFLELKKHLAAAKRISQIFLMQDWIETPGGKQKMLFVDIDGVQQLIVKSRRPDLIKLAERYIGPNELNWLHNLPLTVSGKFFDWDFIDTDLDSGDESNVDFD